MTANPDTILCVDDDEIMLSMLRVRLGRLEGYKVLTAKTIKEALSVARKYRPAVILLDWSLRHDETGLALLRKLRRDPATAAATVLMVTAHNSVGEMEMALDTGADDFICKPLDLDNLARKVRLCCERFAMAS